MSKPVKERLMWTTSLAIQSATAGDATRFSRLQDSCNKALKATRLLLRVSDHLVVVHLHVVGVLHRFLHLHDVGGHHHLVQLNFTELLLLHPH